MAYQSSIFPAFIRAEYDPSGQGFSFFEKEAGESANRARRQFESNFAEVERVVSGALSRGLKSNGALDLGVDGFRQAAAQARAYEQSLRTTRDAAQSLAISTGDTSGATRSFLQAMSAQVIEASRSRAEAEAQVITYTRLQNEISATASKNTMLAASYREVYAEQARSTNRAHYAQKSVNELVAPGLSRSAVNDGAGFSALEEQLVRQQNLVRQLNAGVAELEQRFARESAEQARASDMATVALLRQTQALEELRRAEAGAANGAAMLNAIMRYTGAGMAFSNSAASSAAAFEQRFAEQSRAAQQYARSAAALRAELDPMFVAQQRFDREMDRADDLMRAGAISAREYAAAQLMARQNLQAASAAIHTQNLGFQDLTRRAGMMRMAYVQTGQQMQDVTISLMGGQRASIVFAQQIPQLAFALSHLGMQADGTQRGIGRIATILSGPYSVALAGAAYGVGLLVEKLWGQDAASKAAADAAKKHQSAIDALNESMERSIQSAEDKARADLVALDTERRATIETLKRNQALLVQAKILAENAKGSWIGANGPNGAQSVVSNQYATQVEKLEKAIKKNQDDIDRLTQTSTIARANYQSEILDSTRTAEGRAGRRYEIEINEAKKSGASAAELERLYRARDAEIAKIREAEQALKRSGSARDQEAATVGQISKLILSNLPGTITSGARTASENQRAGGSKTSYHLKGQAVDFVPAGGMGSVTKEQIRAVFKEAGVTIKELLGPGDKGHSDHFHVAWEGGKNEINSDRITDQLAREAERKAAEAQRASEELDRATQTLFSRFDEGRASALEYANVLAEIDRLMQAGRISKDDALSYQIAAGQQKAANDNAREDKAMSELDKALGGPMRKEVARFNAEQEAALKRQADLARQAQAQIDNGLQQIADFFGNDVARMLDRLSAHLAPDSELNQLLSGIGVGRDKMWDSLGDQVSGALKKSGINAEGLGQTLGQVMAGAEMGRMFGKGFTDIFGIKGSKLGSEIGGAIGSAIGGPIGAVVGGTIGSITGGLFKTAKWGTTAVTGNSDSDVQVSGNKAAYRSNSSLAGTSIQSGLDSIAEQFGVDVGGYNVSIGQYKGKWRVSTTGRTGKLKGGPNRTDIKDFGEDGAEDAIKYAIADAVKDGALVGLRASTQALLAASDDVESQLQKALDFENVFARLKEYKDPVGAALDTLDKEFKRLQNIFDEAGASAQEYADLEELYGIERAAAVKEAAEKVTASLQSLFDDLTVGNDARSLRDRLVEAQANYDPLAQRVAAGDTTAYDDYAEAAQTLLDLQREISGSGEDYFALLDQVTALTKSRIDAETSIAEASAGRESLFASDESLAPVVSATESQTAQIVAALNDNNTTLLSAMQVQTDNIISLARVIAANSNASTSSSEAIARQNF